MRLLKSGLLLVALSGLCAATLQAVEPGDFAPRGSLLYTRIHDLAGAAKKLAGDDWRDQVERMLLVRNQRDFDESEALIEEIRGFADFFGDTEFIIGDVMIREPFIQSATIVRLKEGAPTEFSEAFRDWVKENDRKAEIKPDSITFEGVTIRITKGYLIIITGGMMDAHIADVLDGFSDESLSKVERFAKWNAKANGDIVLYADMKAWRAAIDRLGEDFDREARFALETVEWQKWELITGSVNLPGKTGGLGIDVNLSLNQPFEKVNAFLKPAGGSRLVNVLPSECIGFVSMQLGRGHEQTYTDLLHFFHDFDQNERPNRIRRQIGWMEQDLKWTEEELRSLENEDKESDKDGTPDPQTAKAEPAPVPREDGDGDGPTLEERKADLKARIESQKEEIAALQKQLDAMTYRPFEPDPEQRKDRRSDAENFHDNINETFRKMGLTREVVLSAIGQEAIMGILNLPDPNFDRNDLDRAYEDMWFVLVETDEGWPEVKEKLLDTILARKFPDDMPEEDRERAKRQAEKAMFKQVEGGEILRPKGLRADWCAFAGDSFVGIAPNQDVALRILKSGVGQGRMATGNIPGGSVSGSKFAHVNLRDILQKLVLGEMNRNTSNASFPDPHFDLAKYLPGGFHVSLSSDEGSQGISLSLRTGGESSPAPVMKMFADAIERHKAYRHDRDTLNELSRAIRGWQDSKIEAFKEMGDGERARLIKSVDPQSLVAEGLFKPEDGLRSCFDPAMAERFQAMLHDHAEFMGPAKDQPDDLSDSSYEWFGLPTDLQYSDERGWFRADDKNPWIICQMQGNWALDGRMCLIWSSSSDVHWLSVAELSRLRTAITSGEKWEPFDARNAPQPEWRARKEMARKEWEMQDLIMKLAERREALKQEGKDARLKFNGSLEANAGKALRELLGLSEDDWFNFENAGNLTVETGTDGKVKARFEKWGQWIELTEREPNDENGWEPYVIKSSFDE
ncbi:MAG: hypothetical protein KDB90_12320 [Planctomycetes bacterium]|nr:hypothetical protein [Planctomycetota bacterium]